MSAASAMKVLFVSRDAGGRQPSPIVFSQGESLRARHVDVHFHLIRGKGPWGYVRSILPLRALVREGVYDIIHAHYSLSGFVAALAGSRPLVVSLMGSEMYGNWLHRKMVTFFSNRCWTAVIVKSAAMKARVRADRTEVIPNGVDMNVFRPLERGDALRKTRFTGKKNVIFVGNPQRPEKNFALAREAVGLLQDRSVELHALYRHPHDALPAFMNAADVLLLTSLYEGSPNVIKEAMACNCPIVATAVGDIPWVIGETEGCFLADPTPEDVASKVHCALAFNRRTNGRQRVIDLGLDGDTIARRIVDVYRTLIDHREQAGQ
jgi:glycosyltransferase involved in cell wall biosynthesis